MNIARSLRNRPTAYLWVSQLISASGSEFYSVAIVWVATSLAGPKGGYVSAFHAGMLLVGSIFGGVLTDRWRHSGSMFYISIFRALMLIALGQLALLGQLNVMSMAIIVGIIAFATSTYAPSLQALLVTITPDRTELHSINGLFDATRRMARIIGPTTMAAVNGLVPMGHYFFITAAGFLISALGVRGATSHVVEPPPLSRRGARAVLDSIVGGMYQVQGSRTFLYGLFADCMGNITWSIGLLLGMALLLKRNSLEPLADFSLMMVAYGAGNLVTNLVLARLPVRHPLLWLTISKVIFGAGVMLLSIIDGRAAVLIAAALTAVNGPLENLSLLHLMQSQFPADRIAQVFRFERCCAFLGLLLGYLTAPLLLLRYDTSTVVAGAGALSLLTGLVGGFMHRCLKDGHRSGRTT